MLGLSLPKWNNLQYPVLGLSLYFSLVWKKSLRINDLAYSVQKLLIFHLDNNFRKGERRDLSGTSTSRSVGDFERWVGEFSPAGANDSDFVENFDFGSDERGVGDAGDTLKATVDQYR